MEEEINLKNLSIIFVIGLAVLLIGAYFFLNSGSEGTNPATGAASVNTDSVNDHTDSMNVEKKPVSACDGLDGQILNDFEDDTGVGVENGGNTISQKIEQGGLCKSYLSVNYIFNSKEQHGDYFSVLFDNNANWEGYNKFNFLIKCDSKGLGPWSCLKVMEKDGDLWRCCSRDFNCLDNQWTLISTPLDEGCDFEQSPGNGKHDWDEVVKYWLAFSKLDEKGYSIALDKFYLTK